MAPLFSTPAQTRPVCHYASLFIFLSFSMTIKCCLCKGMLGGTAHPHLTALLFEHLPTMRTTKYPDPWNFLEKMLLEKDSENRAAHYVSQSHSLHSQALLWLKKLVVEADTVADPTMRIYPVYDENPFLCQSTSQHAATVSSPEQKSNVNCSLPVQNMLGA